MIRAVLSFTKAASRKQKLHVSEPGAQRPAASPPASQRGGGGEAGHDDRFLGR